MRDLRIKFTLRTLLRNRNYTLLNLTGLGIGLAVSIVVYLYIQDELNYDENIPNYKRVYRVNARFELDQQQEQVAGTSLSLGPLLARDYSYIHNFTRFLHYDYTVTFRRGEREYFEDNIAVADSNFFRVFQTDFLAGSAESCLVKPRSIVITESFAQKYFPDETALGKHISTNNFDYRVTGVIPNLPGNTHHSFDAVISAFNEPVPLDELKQSLWEATVFTFLEFEHPDDAARLKDDFPQFYKRYMEEAGRNLGGYYDIDLVRLDRIHYGHKYQFDRPTGKIVYLYAFGAIGLLILILAGINYVNMATARGMGRAREAGLRKIFGSSAAQIRTLVLTESIILSLIALFLAFTMVETVLELTSFNHILDKDLSLDFRSYPLLLIVPLVMALLVGVLSGWYPALVLSRVPAVSAIRGGYSLSRKSTRLRRFLVGFQFCMSVAVVITALLMYRQMNFLSNMDLGFNKEDVVLVPIQDSATSARIPRLRQALEETPYVLSSSVAWSVPGNNLDRTLLSIEERAGGYQREVVDLMYVGEGYLETMEIGLLEGRAFNQQDLNAPEPVLIVNEEMANFMDWHEPLGKSVQWGFDDTGEPLFQGRVVGVVENFNTHSLHQSVRPTVMFLQNDNVGNLHIRVDSQHLVAALNNLENAWGSVIAGSPFRFSFLNRKLMSLYQEERRQSTVVLLLTYLAISLSFLGLTGMASFTAGQRTREIGIRKILGADVGQMLNLVFRDMLSLIVFSVILALPVAYLLIQGWLANFAYTAKLDPVIFAISAAAAILLAYLIVSYHSLKVARFKPVDILKHE